MAQMDCGARVAVHVTKGGRVWPGALRSDCQSAEYDWRPLRRLASEMKNRQTGNDLMERQLEKACRDCPSSHMAYLDETFRVPAQEWHNKQFFYALAAYIAPVADRVSIDADLEGVVGGTRWHATQSQQTSAGKEKLRAFCEHLGDLPASDHLMIVRQVPIGEDDSTGEKARSLCLGEMLTLLESGSAPGIPAVDLIVAERRKTREMMSLDEQTVRKARSSGQISRKLRVIWGSPAYARGLWVADTLAYALYREDSTRGEDPYMRAIGDRVRFIDL